MKIHQLKAYFALQKERNDKVIEIVRVLNIQRFKLFSIIGVPVSLAHIFVFIFINTETSAEENWRLGIIVAHAMLATLLSIFGLVGSYATKKDFKSEYYKYLQIAFMLTVMAFGIVITGIDQLVSTNVTPFIMASLVCGIALYSRPMESTLIYLLGVLGFVLTMAFTVEDLNVRLSNQVNGLTIGALGLLLSMLLWQRKLTTLEQQTMINAQKKELEKSNKKLEKYANYDLLTGLLNRFAFNQAIEKYLLNPNVDGFLIFLDIDYFKTINDSYGHPVGDKLLKAFSEDLTTTFEDGGTICRWGGDEFLVFLPKISSKQVQTSIDKFLNIVRSKTYEINNHAINITISCGITRKKEANKEYFYSIYERSDKALYKAKENGRNTMYLL